jgi:alkaline phosphatase
MFSRYIEFTFLNLMINFAHPSIAIGEIITARDFAMTTINNFFKLSLFIFIVNSGIGRELFAEKIEQTKALNSEKGTKYVFLFIGDGMGPLQRTTADKAFKSDKKPGLWMNTLPVKGGINTLSYGGKITDSAASATALASGVKTRNGMLGLDHNGKRVETIAEIAKKNGRKVGIVTSVQLNHATPAGFYAHRMKRYMYDEIIADLAVSNFEYFGGGSFRIKGDKEQVLQKLKDANYIMIESPKEMPKLDSDKKYIVHTHLPYVIDRKKDSGLTLADFTKLGIDHIYSGTGKTKGFFMMIEGGRIDWSGHANDGGTLIKEVKAFDNAIKAALDFYAKHPKLTTIIVVADHETGGLHSSSGGIKPGWDASRLTKQKYSYGVMNSKLREYKKQQLSLEKVLPLLKENYAIKEFSPEELKQIKLAWGLFTGAEKSKKKTSYGSYNPVILCAQHIFVKRCGLKWTNTGHSALAVPITAIGVDAKLFGGYYDNTQIAHKLKSIIKSAEKK